MASAEALAKLETKAVAAEKLIELLRQQISQVSGLCIFSNNFSHCKTAFLGESSSVRTKWWYGGSF